LGPPNSTSQAASRSAQSFSEAHDCDRQTDRQTDKPTDHATRSVRISRTYVRSTATRPNNNNWSFDKKTASPLHSEGSIVFARLRQCAPHIIHPPLGPSPQPKRHLCRFSHFAHLTAECRRACQGMSFPLDIIHSHEEIWTFI